MEHRKESINAPMCGPHAPGVALPPTPPQGTITPGLPGVTDRTPATPESSLLSLGSESLPPFLGQAEIWPSIKSQPLATGNQPGGLEGIARPFLSKWECVPENWLQMKHLLGACAG